MTEWIERRPAVDVPIAEYQRLLGFPRDHEMEGRPAELAEWAVSWYREHGQPWTFARLAGAPTIDGETVEIEGAQFQSEPLRRRFVRAAADGVVLAAVSAGPELEAEAQRLWQDEKPDEYYFLEVLGSAVVERLVVMTGERLCAWGEGQGMAVLPHYSPGYPGWDISEQSRLLALMHGAGKNSGLPGELEALASGALRPKKSLLAVFGLTRHVEGVRGLTDMVSCERCAMVACQYRRKSRR